MKTTILLVLLLSSVLIVYACPHHTKVEETNSDTASQVAEVNERDVLLQEMQQLMNAELQSMGKYAQNERNIDAQIEVFGNEEGEEDEEGDEYSYEEEEEDHEEEEDDEGETDDSEEPSPAYGNYGGFGDDEGEEEEDEEGGDGDIVDGVFDGDIITEDPELYEVEEDEGDEEEDEEMDENGVELTGTAIEITPEALNNYLKEVEEEEEEEEDDEKVALIQLILSILEQKGLTADEFEKIFDSEQEKYDFESELEPFGMNIPDFIELLKSAEEQLQEELLEELLEEQEEENEQDEDNEEEDITDNESDEDEDEEEADDEEGYRYTRSLKGKFRGGNKGSLVSGGRKSGTKRHPVSTGTKGVVFGGRRGVVKGPIRSNKKSGGHKVAVKGPSRSNRKGTSLGGRKVGSVRRPNDAGRKGVLFGGRKIGSVRGPSRSGTNRGRKVGSVKRPAKAGRKRIKFGRVGNSDRVKGPTRTGTGRGFPLGGGRRVGPVKGPIRTGRGRGGKGNIGTGSNPSGRRRRVGPVKKPFRGGVKKGHRLKKLLGPVKGLIHDIVNKKFSHLTGGRQPYGRGYKHGASSGLNRQPHYGGSPRGRYRKAKYNGYTW